MFKLTSLLLLCLTGALNVVHAESDSVSASAAKPATLLGSKIDKSQGEWVGQPAADFRLQDQNQQWHTLKDYKGKWLVLYFYPMDDTPGCTEEARQFRDLYPTFKQRNIAVLGISLNKVASHKSFADKLGLPFPILSDAQHDLAKAYKVLRGFGMMSYTARETFLIDPQGTIVYHYSSVNTQSHAGQVLKDIAQLSAGK